MFEEPNELVIGLYQQREDTLLASATLDSADLQRRVLAYANEQLKPQGEEEGGSLDFWIPLTSTSAAHRLTLSSIELHVTFKFRSSSEIVRSIHDMAADIFASDNGEEFLLIQVAYFM